MDVPVTKKPYRLKAKDGFDSKDRADMVMTNLLSKGPDYFKKLMDMADKDEQVARSPNTQILQDIWLGHFKAFLRLVLKVDEDFVPDEKSIVQFLITMAHETPGKCGPNETLSLHTMETALDIIREYCIFTYRDRFIQKRGFSKRIEAHLEKLVKQGILTRARSKLPRATPEEINRICEAEGLHPSIKNHRSKAQKIRRERWQDDWAEKQIALLDKILPSEGGDEASLKGSPDVMDLDHVDTSDDESEIDAGTDDDDDIDDIMRSEAAADVSGGIDEVEPVNAKVLELPPTASESTGKER